MLQVDIVVHNRSVLTEGCAALWIRIINKLISLIFVILDLLLRIVVGLRVVCTGQGYDLQCLPRRLINIRYRNFFLIWGVNNGLGWILVTWFNCNCCCLSNTWSVTRNRWWNFLREVADCWCPWGVCDHTGYIVLRCVPRERYTCRLWIGRRCPILILILNGMRYRIGQIKVCRIIAWGILRCCFS